MQIYDKAKWHYEGNFPEGLQQEQAFVHTGMYLGWLVERGLIDDSFADDFEDEIELYRRKSITGAKLYELTGGSLVEDQLTEEGNSFSSCYYDLGNGDFLADYENTLVGGLPTVYHVSDTWENFEKIKLVIDLRFEEWKSEASQPNIRKRWKA